MATLIYLVTEDWYFVSHRLPLAMAARQAGFEVKVACRVAKHGDVIKAAGIDVLPLHNLQRGSAGLLSTLAAAREIAALYRRERPALVHHVGIQAVVLGSIAGRLAGVGKAVNLLAGLGFVFASRSFRARLLRPLIVLLMRLLLNRPGVLVVVQNPDDAEQLQRHGIVPAARRRVIAGSGVDADRFAYARPPGMTPLRVVLASRMLWDKGVGEFVEAARLLAARRAPAKFILVGNTDDSNPACIPPRVLDDWRAEGVVDWWGQRTDMAEVLRETDIVCLPSYREGLPKILLEAMSCGRPCVTTDTPGCRDAVRDGDNGLLVPVRGVEELADAIERLLTDADLRTRMGRRGRERVEAEFAQEIVIEKTLAVYRELLA